MEVLSSRILLQPADLPAARRFYEDQLGLKVYREYGAHGRVSGVVYFLGGGFLELSGAGGGMVGAGAGPCIWVQVDDVDGVHDRLGVAGVPVDDPPATMPWGLREMWIHDPDGVRIVVVEVPADHPLRRSV